MLAIVVDDASYEMLQGLGCRPYLNFRRVNFRFKKPNEKGQDMELDVPPTGTQENRPEPGERTNVSEKSLKCPERRWIYIGPDESTTCQGYNCIPG